MHERWSRCIILSDELCKILLTSEGNGIKAKEEEGKEKASLPISLPFVDLPFPFPLPSTSVGLLCIPLQWTGQTVKINLCFLNFFDHETLTNPEWKYYVKLQRGVAFRIETVFLTIFCHFFFRIYHEGTHKNEDGTRRVMKTHRGQQEKHLRNRQRGEVELGQLTVLTHCLTSPIPHTIL